MTERSAAEEHLRVIRSLMEKASIYRAISAEAALVGGVLSLGLAGYLATARLESTDRSAAFFVTLWLVVLAITATTSAALIRRDALRRGEPFLSAGLRSAARAMLPPLLCGAVMSVLLALMSFHLLPPFWMLFYGLALLATAHFAPPSIARLGWAFVVAALVCLTFLFLASFALSLTAGSMPPSRWPPPSACFT